MVSDAEEFNGKAFVSVVRDRLEFFVCVVVDCVSDCLGVFQQHGQTVNAGDLTGADGHGVRCLAARVWGLIGVDATGVHRLQDCFRV